VGEGAVIDLETSSHALRRDPRSGIWTPKEDTGAEVLSFPETGHAACFAIEDASFWFEHRNECILEALRRASFEGRFLDAGGGNGVVSKALERAGHSTVMLEPGPEGAANARARGLPNVVCATVEKAGFEAGSFEGAGLFDVIEHVEDDLALLSATRRVLVADGLVCVTVPAFEWLWSAEDELAGHYRRYTREGLDAVLRRAGFTPLYSTYFFAPLTMPFFLLRSLPHRFLERRPSAVEEGAARQHTPNALTRRAVDLLLSPERRRIAAGKGIPFGTSCLAVARVSGTT